MVDEETQTTQDEKTSVAEKTATTAEASAPEETAEEVKASSDVVLSGIYGQKVGMSAIYDEQGVRVPVTVISCPQWTVTQVKTMDKEGYTAVQVACDGRKASKSPRSAVGHFSKAGLTGKPRFVKELRQELPEGVTVGQKVSYESLTKGQKVRVTGKSKGRGFTGVMKRHGFAGGPASHGSGFHRRPGSIGNCEFPGRVQKGRKMPGQHGNKFVTYKNVEVVGVLPDEKVVLLKGPVPGGRHSLVKIIGQ